MGWDEFGDYESAAERKARMQRRVEQRRGGGEPFIPTVCKIKRGMPATTFWGKAWCQNLEAYSDYEHRLPRGRTYLRHGAVHDLEIGVGEVSAYVTGGEIYEVNLCITALAGPRWSKLKRSIAGEVRNLVALLSGDLGDGVMQAVTNMETGLFPSPDELSLSCTCPDWAECCKHVAAVMYAIGVHLDTNPELLFTLRDVDHRQLISTAALEGVQVEPDDVSAQVLAAGELAELFGIDLADPESAF